MIYSQHGAERHVVAQTIDIVTISLPPNRFGMERRKAPVLASDEQLVGRRTGGSVQDKQLALAPDIIAIAIYSQGKIQIEADTPVLCLSMERGCLFGAQPLDVEMKALGGLVIVVGRQDAVSTRSLPVEPSFALALDLGAKRGVVPNTWFLCHKLFETFSSWRMFFQKKSQQLFQDFALECHLPAVVY